MKDAIPIIAVYDRVKLMSDDDELDNISKVGESILHRE